LDFGHMLRTLRLSAGMGLRELSRVIDVSPTYMSLVENGKQAPPNAARVAQIEDALRVPPGSLMSLIDGLGADATMFVREVPETMDFLGVAEKNSMSSTDFMELTGFLNVFGWDWMRKSLRQTNAAAELLEDSRGRRAGGPYVWPFLREEIIFDVSDVKEKEGFLRKAVAVMAARNGEMDEGAVLDKLLERERVTSTGIGDGVAIPHAFLPELDHMIVALARIHDGLDFDAIDGRPVRLALLLVGPRSAENMHLRLLARIAKLLSHKSFMNSLLDAPGPGEIISIFRAAEMRIP